MNHHNGKWVGLPPGESVATGYKHIADATVRRTNTLGLDAGTMITLADNEPTEVITATGVGKSTEDRVPMVIFRRTGQHADYVWAVALDGKAVKVEVKAGEVMRVKVEAPERTWEVAVDTEKAKVRVTP